MKQNSNINLTKITSGALVLLLASGGLFSNSLAKDNNSNNVEKVIVEKKDNIEDKNLDRTELSEVEKKNLDKKSEENNQTIEEKTVEKSTIQDVINDLDKDADKKIEEKEVENNLPLEASAPEKNESLSLKENENLSLEKEEENNIDENISLNNTNNSINNNLEIENTKIQEVSSEKLDENNEPATKLIEDESKEKPALLEDDKSVEDDNALEISKVREKENVQSSQQDKKVSVSTYQSNVQKPKYINDYSNNKEFLEMLASHSSLAKEYNIFPEVMMGQAILESGWGQSALAKYNKNLFGVKVPYSERGKGKGVVYKTNEEINGKTIRISDEFRKFDTYEQSIRQYLNLLTGDYYSRFGVNTAKNYKEQIQRIKAAGYATDSRYVNSVLNVISSSNLSEVANRYLGTIVEKPKTILVKNNSSSSKLKASKKTNNASKSVKRSNPIIVKKEVNNVSSVSVKKTPILKNTLSTKIKKVENLEKPKVIENVKKEVEYKIEISSPTSTTKVGKSLSLAEPVKDKNSKITYSKKTGNSKKEKSTKAILQAKSDDLVDKNKIYKTENKNYRKNQQVTENIVKTNNSYNNIESNDVQTGVGSLSSVLLTLSASSIGLFSSKKRK